MRAFDESSERIDRNQWLDFAYPCVLDYSLPAAISDAVKDSIGLLRGYPHLAADLVAQISRYLGVPTANIMLTGGVNGGLELVARGLLRGCGVLVPVPAFWQLVDAFTRNQVDVATVPVETPQDFDTLVDTERSRSIVLCSPNNPLTFSLDSTLVSTIASARPSVFVIVDESYADYAGRTVARLVNEHENVIVLRGFKTFMIPGARIGYLLAPEQIIRRLKMHTVPFAQGVLAEVAAIAALTHVAEIREIWAAVRRDLGYLAEHLAGFGGEILCGETPFVFWRVDGAAAIGRGLAERKIACVFPGRWAITGNRSGIRITGRKPEIVDRLLQSLPEVIATGAGSSAGR